MAIRRLIEGQGMRSFIAPMLPKPSGTACCPRMHCLKTTFRDGTMRTSWSSSLYDSIFAGTTMVFLFPVQARAGLILSHLGLEEIFLLANVGLLVEPWQPAFRAREWLRDIDLARPAVGDIAELLHVIIHAISKNRLAQ